MEALIINRTEDTPGIEFNPSKGYFMISNRSWPENAIEFYKEVFDWLDEYMKAPNETSIFEFNLEYFNTASAKQIAKLLLLLEKHSKKTNIIIRWHYDKDDLDMLTSGSRYAKLLNIKYEFVEH